MSAPAITATVDPTGLNGERVHRDEIHAPDVCEIWRYPADLAFEAIEAAWRSAPRRGRSLVLCVSVYQQRAGSLYVTVRRYEEPEPAPVHIEEPLDV